LRLLPASQATLDPLTAARVAGVPRSIQKAEGLIVLREFVQLSIELTTAAILEQPLGQLNVNLDRQHVRVSVLTRSLLR